MVKRGVKSLPWPWAVMWCVLSVLTLAFVSLRMLPAFAEFMDLADRHPEMMLESRGVFVLAALLGWLTLGLLALLYLQAFFRRLSERRSKR